MPPDRSATRCRRCRGPGAAAGASRSPRDGSTCVPGASASSVTLHFPPRPAGFAATENRFLPLRHADWCRCLLLGELGGGLGEGRALGGFWLRCSVAFGVAPALDSRSPPLSYHGKLWYWWADPSPHSSQSLPPGLPRSATPLYRLRVSMTVHNVQRVRLDPHTCDAWGLETGRFVSRFEPQPSYTRVCGHSTVYRSCAELWLGRSCAAGRTTASRTIEL